MVGRISDFFTEYHRRCFEAGRGVIDVTQVTDDFGSQTGLMICPRVFDTSSRGMQRGIDLANPTASSSFTTMTATAGSCCPGWSRWGSRPEPDRVALRGLGFAGSKRNTVTGCASTAG